jgi:hypothetical protein
MTRSVLDNIYIIAYLFLGGNDIAAYLHSFPLFWGTLFFCFLRIRMAVITTAIHVKKFVINLAKNLALPKPKRGCKFKKKNVN